MSIWNTPKTWATFAPTKQLIEEHYTPVDFETIFLDASAPDVGQVEHAFQICPNRPKKLLTKHCKLRTDLILCAFLKHVYLHPTKVGVYLKIRLPQPRQSVKTDRHGGFTPPCEVFHLKRN